MTEKRYLKRRKRRFALRFGLSDATRLGFTEDICAEGMFIRTAHVHAPGTTLMVSLSLRHESFVLIRGKVMWAKRSAIPMERYAKTGFGLKIESFINGEENYLQACATTLYPP